MHDWIATASAIWPQDVRFLPRSRQGRQAKRGEAWGALLPLAVVSPPLAFTSLVTAKPLLLPGFLPSSTPAAALPDEATTAECPAAYTYTRGGNGPWP